MILRDLVRLLNGLHPSLKHRLGIPRTRRRRRPRRRHRADGVRLFNNMARVIDPPHTPHNRDPRGREGRGTELCTADDGTVDDGLSPARWPT